MGAVYGSLERDDDVLTIGMNRAVDLLAKKLASVRTIGPHPGNKEPVSVRKGRFGPYVQHGKTVANLPRGVLMDDVTLDEAVALLKEKGKTLRPRGAGARRGGRGAAAKQANGAGTAGRQTAAASGLASARVPVTKSTSTKTPARRKAPAKRAAKPAAQKKQAAAPAAQKKQAAAPAAKKKRAATPAKKAAAQKRSVARAAASHRAST
jgi:DNA topoisomerase-1